MDLRRGALALALSVLLVVAGCSVPVAPDSTPQTEPATTSSGETQTEGNTESPSGDSTTTLDSNESAQGAIDVRNGSLPFDEERVFDDLLTLLGVNVTPPAVVAIRGHESLSTPARGLPAFAQTMGITGGSGEKRTSAAGITQGADYIALNARILSNHDATLSVLVHEYVHVVQFRKGQIDAVTTVTDDGTTDGKLTGLAVVEGIPVYVEDQYEHTYGDGEPTSMDSLVASYRNATGTRKYVLAPYRFGARYAEARAGSASAVESIYENPPRTTEAIIHGYAPGEEPRRTLRSNITTGSWSWSDRDSHGELFVRHVLVTQISSSRAAEAAAGWGMDRSYTFTNGTSDGYVWVLRWDSVQDADEFETATTDYLDGRGSRVDGTWTANGTAFRVERPSPEQVVILAGPDVFVSNTSVSGTNETVRIRAA